MKLKIDSWELKRHNWKNLNDQEVQGEERALLDHNLNPNKNKSWRRNITLRFNDQEVQGEERALLDHNLNSNKNKEVEKKYNIKV